MKIHWNGFLKHAVDQYPKEACAFLFSRRPYSPEEEWFVFPVKNVPKHGEDPRERWDPDRSEMQRVKTKAIKMGLVKIGNTHTHPWPENEPFDENLLKEVMRPSEIDLRFARRFNDIIRGIIVVDNKAIYGIRFHDKFGNEIPITVVEGESD